MAPTHCSWQVPLPLPGRAAGNCVGQHRIFLKGCNAKHGFYVFKYVYSFSTRRNQTQIKKEEADSQSIIPGRQLDEDDARQEPTEGRVAPEHTDNSSTEVIQSGTVLKPKNHSSPGAGRPGSSPRPGSATRARGGIGIAGPTPSSSEGSGDLDLVVEVDDGVPILPQDERPSEAVVGNRSSFRSEDKDDGAPRVVPVEGAMPARREKGPAAGGAGDEGSGEATVSGQGQEGGTRGTGMGGVALASVTEKMEDVQVDTEGLGEYTYIPDSGSVTIAHGNMGSTTRTTSFTQISPDKDDEINIFIGRANIHVGEQEATQASTTVDREDDSSSLPRLGVTGGDDDSFPTHRQPEGLTTTATPGLEDSTTSSLRDGRPTGDDEEGATSVSGGEGLVTPGPWRVTGGGITIPTVASIPRKDDDEVRGEGQRFRGKSDQLASMTPRPWDDTETTATVSAERASILLTTTMPSPGLSEGDCTTPLGTTSSHQTATSTVLGRGGSGDVGPATPKPRREGWPGAGVKVHPGGAGLGKTPRTEKVPSPSGKASGQASSEDHTRVGGRGGDAGGRWSATKASPLQALLLPG
ncbi:PREDICTED: ovocleidin-116-like [Acanthisitta chloris]|uniref:ovocleidin-116-like n=1 Tax=Acanthisitta chloris TaxID=57068 RepID=UPI0004F0F4CE|nr:PREDICTED: ovocleidin-116-like [Acanthisitta chloris]